jgi:hypothetical protein
MSQRCQNRKSPLKQKPPEGGFSSNSTLMIVDQAAASNTGFDFRR